MDSGERHRGRRLALWRLTGYAVVVVVLLIAIAVSGNLPTPAEVRDWGESLGGFGAIAFVPLFALVNFVIPWGILAGAAGLLFGTALGTPLALAGVTLAALAQMLTTRVLAGEHAGALLPERTKAIERFIEHNGVTAIIQSRIVPLLPYGAVNYAAGLTRLRYRDMALGTFVGAAPKVFGYVALGGSLTNLHSTEAKVAVGVIVALALVGAWMVRAQLLMAWRRVASTPPVSYFTFVRIYSLVEVCVFAALLVVAIGHLGETAETVLGWTHGFGWIILCLLVAQGCRMKVFPWWLLAATVSPLGPVGSTAGIEGLALSRRRRARRVA